LQAPAAVALCLFALYFAVCYRSSLSLLGVAERPFFHDEAHAALWMGRWRMFTRPATRNTAVEGQARYAGGEDWAPLDLEALFPARWESGPRYVRGSFRDNRGRMRVFAAATCGRLDPTPEEVRFEKVWWRVVVGKDPTARRNARRAELLRWSCEAPVKLPKGRRI